MRTETIRGTKWRCDGETNVVKLAIEYPYLCKDRDRHGNVRFYFRRKGHRKVRIYARPETVEFQAAYQAAKTETDREVPSLPPSTDRPKTGTFRWLCVRYFESSDFGELDPKTHRAAPYPRARVGRSHRPRPD